MSGYLVERESLPDREGMKRDDGGGQLRPYHIIIGHGILLLCVEYMR